MSTRNAAKTDSHLAARVAAVASLGAAAIHGAVLPAHWQDSPLIGVFFAATVAFQALWAIAVVLRPTATVLVAGILVNAATMSLWVVSHSVGAPLGAGGGPEPVGAAGICTLLLEAYVVMGAAWVWSRRRTRPVSGFGHGAVLMGAVGVVAAAATVGCVAGMQGDHHGTSGTGGAQHINEGQPHSH